MQFEILTEDTLAQDQRFWRILEAALPAEERESREVLLHCIRQPDVYFIRARDGETTVAVATIQLLRRAPSLFLGYLAVDEQLRGHGLGRALLDYCWTTGMALGKQLDLRLVGMITEVERPLAGPSKDLSSIAAKRLRFYLRSGFTALPAAYHQPPLGRGLPPPMHLLFKPSNPKTSVIDRMLQEDLTEALYIEKYAAHNGINADVLMGLTARDYR